MRTCAPDVIKVLGRSTAALACVLMLASCTSGESESKSAGPCEISPSSEEEVLLREILRAEDFETKAHKQTKPLAEKLGRDLQKMGDAKDSYFNLACTYSTQDQQRTDRALFTFGWSSKAAFETPPLPNGVSYDLNGARGVATGTTVRLFVQCDLPGELGAASRKAWLDTDASYLFRPSRDADQAGKDRRMALTYLMARRVTDALGCENKPLDKPPVVKPLPTP
ncbi:hypothetical protein [Streptomyces sp. NPDC096339]|uniref:hypothetical protein n=1 Tax=Streptomyces sp. NPDC096339 TaxID=3366086 RepID=UPI003816B619